jgi:uncharacterized membrane protein
MARPATAQTRLLTAILLGVTVGAAVAKLGSWKAAPLSAWDSAALVYMIWVWRIILPLTPAEAKTHARREDPGRTWADVILLVASAASLVAVGVLIEQASHSNGLVKALEVGGGLFSVIVSWCIIHTTYTLKYASLYYGDPEGGVDFGQTPPRYSDFAYLAFTLGMTFQVSDTGFKTKEFRSTALRHSLLSYVFGTVIIATTINAIASLGA